MGLVAVARALWARSRCRSHNTPCAQPGVPVSGVVAKAAAPNLRADFLLLPRALSTGKEAEIESEVRASRPAPALARAQRPHPPPGPIARA